MSMPPEAIGPVLTVIRPRRSGAPWARTGKAALRERAPAPSINLLRLKFMPRLLQFFEELLVRHHPAEAARNVLQPQQVKIVAVHAGDAIGKHHHPVVVVERG